MSPVRNPKDFLAGLLFMAFGFATLVIGWSYPLGTISRMGPAYFPRILAALLLGFGALLSLRGFRSTEDFVVRWHWRPLAIVLLGAGVFGLTGQRLGVVGAPDTIRDLEMGVRALEAGLYPMEKLVTHKFSLEDVGKGFEALKNPPTGYVKGIVMP